VARSGATKKASGSKSTGGYIKVEGLNELRTSLRKLQDQTSKKELQQTLKGELRDAAEIVATAARHRAPYRTGRLRDTIRPKGALRGTKVLAGGIRKVRHAGPIHWGWPTRPNPAKGWRGGPIKANPFLWTALQARKGEILSNMERTVVKLTDQVKGL